MDSGSSPSAVREAAEDPMQATEEAHEATGVVEQNVGQAIEEADTVVAQCH
jgi:hypothetical protein